MKVFILNLLIYYILSLYSSNSTTKRQLFYLPLYGSVKYNGNSPGLSILNTSGLEDDIIYIKYYIERSSFNTEILNYGFTDVYPDEYFECTNSTKSSFFSTKINNNKITSISLYFEIEKQDKKYIVLENLLYRGYYIEVFHHKYNLKGGGEIFLYICILLGVGIISLMFYISICKIKKKEINSKSINFQKEEPSPLYPPSQPYDSTQANTIPMQLPSYVPQPIPPEVANSNDTGYLSGMGQQNGYSSGMGEQGYYSGMVVQPS